MFWHVHSASLYRCLSSLHSQRGATHWIPHVPLTPELFYTFTLSCVFRPFPSSKFPNRSLKQNQTLQTTISWPYHPTRRPLYQGHPLPSVKIDWRCSIYSDFFLPTNRWHISTIRLMLSFLLRKLSQNNTCLPIGNRVSALSPLLSL